MCCCSVLMYSQVPDWLAFVGRSLYVPDSAVSGKGAQSGSGYE